MLHILLVEDSGGDALLIREAIRTSIIKAKVTIARDGEQALKLLNSAFAPDLVILDLNLPKVRGLDVLKLSTATAPIVVFTGSKDPKEREHALALGAREFIVKPSNLNEYLSAIRTAIEPLLTA